MLATTGGGSGRTQHAMGTERPVLRGMGGDGDWHRTNVTAEDCPRIDPCFLLEERRTLPSVVYAAEYGVEFGDVGRRRLPPEDIDAAVTEEVLPRWPAG